METVRLNADVFVIPNRAATINEEFISPYFKEDLLNIAASNNIKDVDNERFIQVWIVAEEIGCDNFIRHMSHVVSESGKDIVLMPGMMHEFIPQSVLPSREGESSTVRFFINENDTEVIVNLTAAQRKYRYARFGNWEDVVERVCY